MSARVLVTGGSGFIGTWVIRELLARGTSPIAFDLQPAPERWRRVLGDAASRVAFEAGSLLDRDQVRAVFERHNITHIIHLAALLTPACQEQPWLGFQVNVLGSTALFEWARLRGEALKGFAYASSFAVYGPESDDAPESGGASQNRPSTFYGAFKLAVDLIAEQYWRHYRLASVGIRPHVVYGPERDVGLTAGPSLAARAVALGERYTIGYRGTVGYDYVEDVARAFVRAALETPAGANVVDLPGEQATCEDFVHALCDIAPSADSLITVDGPSIPPNVTVNSKRITDLFPDWVATPLRNGIQQTVDYYRRLHSTAKG